MQNPNLNKFIYTFAYKFSPCLLAKILSKFQPNKKIFFTLFDAMAENLKEVNLILKQVLSN